MYPMKKHENPFHKNIASNHSLKNDINIFKTRILFRFYKKTIVHKNNLTFASGIFQIQVE